MSEHANASRVRELFDAFRRGDVGAIQAVIPDYAVWHFPGRHGQLAGAHRGREAIFAFLLRVQSLTAGSFHLELIDVLANDSRAVALFRGHGERDGRQLDNPTCLSMRLENGQVVEVWEYVWDLYAVDEFWR
jgi:ketosteroid isomerase-like protein